MFSYQELVGVLFVLAGAIALGVAAGQLLAAWVRFKLEDGRQTRRLELLKSSLLAAQREDRKLRQEALRGPIPPALDPRGGVTK